MLSMSFLIALVACSISASSRRATSFLCDTLMLQIEITPATKTGTTPTTAIVKNILLRSFPRALNSGIVRYKNYTIHRGMHFRFGLEWHTIHQYEFHPVRQKIERCL